jgi:hypothetical protein
MRLQRRWGVPILVLLVAGFAASAQRRAFVADGVLIARLSDPMFAVREATVAHILRMKHEERGPALYRALAQELTRVNGLSSDATRRRHAGESLPATPRLAEYRGALIELVAASTDPSVLPGLLEALDSGPLAVRAIARFGRAALPPLQAIATQQNPLNVHSVTGALRALALIAEKETLSAEERKGLIDIAGARTTGYQDPLTVGAACELAVALRDPDLRLRVWLLASNAGNVSALGITDERLIRHVQDAARRALEGE